MQTGKKQSKMRLRTANSLRSARNHLLPRLFCHRPSCHLLSDPDNGTSSGSLALTAVITTRVIHRSRAL